MLSKTRLVWIAVSVIGLLSLTVGSAGALPPLAPKAKWTVMLYMAGDNNLEPYITSDIETELAPAGSNADVQIVALADRIPGFDQSAGDWNGTLIFHVTKEMKATPNNAVVNLGERNTGDGQTLIDFVSWTKTHFPADHYALVFWGHGWSWLTEFTMSDETSNDSLDPHEVAGALPSIGFVDVVAYDGCNMASIEIQTLWKDNSAAIAHSEEFVGADGIEYEKVIPALQADPNISADELATLFSQSAQGNWEKTWSAVTLDEKWDTLQSAVDEWAVALMDGLPTHRKAFDQAFNLARSFWQDPAAKDLYDAAFEIKARVKDRVIQAKSQAVMDAVSAVVLDEWHVNAYEDVRGITIYLPNRASQFDYRATTGNDFEYYRANLGFADHTHWDEFLTAYLIP
jgi:Clostripain family